jgi:hypothetical protein
MRTPRAPPPSKEMHPRGHAGTQLRQPMHRTANHCSSLRGEMLSGLWHQRQESGHCLRNTVDLIPGPSSVDSRCT